MNRTGIAVAAGVLGLLSVAMLIRHRHNQAPEQDEGPAPRAERGDSRSASAFKAQARRAGARDDSDDGLDGAGERQVITDTLARARLRSAQQPHGGAGAPGDPDERMAAQGSDTNAPGSDSAAAVEAHPGTTASGSSGAATPGAGQKDADKADDGLALSLKFDKSTLPEKGNTAPIIEQGITFDGDGARFAADAQFAIPNAGNVSGAAGTISFRLLPEWVGEVDTNASLVQLRTNTFENRIQIFKNGPYLRFIFCDNTGVESGVGISITNWQPNQGHVVTATWGDGVTSLYIDGQSVGSKEYNGELQVGPETPLLIGSDHADGAPGARGAISDFKIFTRALSADEVAVLAAQSQR